MTMLQRPIFGGAFGDGRYALATLPVIAHGLHAVKYLVIEQQLGTVLAIAEDKREALGAARRLLQAANDEALGPQWQQEALWASHETPTPLAAVAQPARPVSRRRREIHGKSGGRCHYCGTALALDLPFHVDHMRPRALDGGDDSLNLVATCVACNLAKRDRTALEFVATLYDGARLSEAANGP